MNVIKLLISLLFFHLSMLITLPARWSKRIKVILFALALQIALSVLWLW